MCCYCSTTVCFPGPVEIILENGNKVTMSELQVGDTVQAVLVNIYIYSQMLLIVVVCRTPNNTWHNWISRILPFICNNLFQNSAGLFTFHEISTAKWNCIIQPSNIFYEETASNNKHVHINYYILEQHSQLIREPSNLHKKKLHGEIYAYVSY